MRRPGSTTTGTTRRDARPARIPPNGARMALEDIEAELTGVVPWRTCAVCHHLAERDPAWGERMRRMLANRGIKFRALAEKLAKDDAEPDIPEDALSRHARGLCAAKEVLRETGEKR